MPTKDKQGINKDRQSAKTMPAPTEQRADSPRMDSPAPPPLRNPPAYYVGVVAMGRTPPKSVKEKG